MNGRIFRLSASQTRLSADPNMVSAATQSGFRPNRSSVRSFDGPMTHWIIGFSISLLRMAPTSAYRIDKLASTSTMIP
ncbi:hypothetical protein RSK20926_11574 [Roseobacter sp. SK209-2-6]|nr:hypothetical protein RSK20926_11574 [Roseobacter sp. SK209-2-6]